MPKSIILVFLSLVLTSACVKQAGQPANDTLPSQVQSIVVLPVEVAAETAITSPQTKKQLQNGKETLTQIVSEYFANNAKTRLLSVEEVESFSPGYGANQTAQAQFVGKAVKAEAVMLWELNRYSERSGGDYAVQAPASVAFTYRLVLTESGETLCAGSFDETQQPASENLLSLKKNANRGFKWITAADLAREGVIKKLPACSYLKKD